MRALGFVVFVALLAGCGEGERSFEAPLVLGGQEVSPELLNRGEFAYARYCRGCHGPSGHGDGPYAASLTPRPADLTTGEYARLGATGGELPSDDAIARVIREGIEGTAMVPQGISDQNVEALVAYVKTLAPVWRQGEERDQRQ